MLHPRLALLRRLLMTLLGCLTSVLRMIWMLMDNKAEEGMGGGDPIVVVDEMETGKALHF